MKKMRCNELSGYTLPNKKEGKSMKQTMTKRKKKAKTMKQTIRNVKKTMEQTLKKMDEKKQ